MEALVIFDCDKIQQYVYASSRQKEIRSASHLLENTTEEVKNLATKSGGDPVKVAAGSGLVVFEGNGALLQAENFLNSTVKKYSEIGIGCTGFIVNNFKGRNIISDFGQIVNDAELELRKRKDSTDRREVVLGLPLFVPCESTGLDPAEETGHPPAPERRLSAVAFKQRNSNHRVKNATLWWEKKFQETLGYNNADFWGGLVAEDIEGLAKLILNDSRKEDNRREQVKVALLSADVDDAGKTFAQMNKEDYKCNSVKLMEWLAVAMAEACKVLAGKPPYPVFPLYVGGDDLLLYVPAHMALRFAEKFMQIFLKKQSEQKFTLSCGVAFGKEKTPFRQLADASQEAESMSKLFRRITNAREKCHVQYHVFRGVLPSGASGADAYPVSAGPFEVSNSLSPGQSELGALLKAIEDLRGHTFPSNKIKEWAFLPSVSKEEASSRYARSVKNLGDEHEKLLQEAMEKLTGQRDISGLPFRVRAGRPECPLVDIPVLWNLVEA